MVQRLLGRLHRHACYGILQPFSLFFVSHNINSPLMLGTEREIHTLAIFPSWILYAMTGA
jgi:hypothetical protein